MEVGNIPLILISAIIANCSGERSRSPSLVIIFAVSCWGTDPWLVVHREPPTITKIFPCKTALGITNVKQNGLIRSSLLKCAQTKAPGILQC